MIPVILSGGSGTRLWPISRTKIPKQFSEIFAQTLHASTIQRLTHYAKPWIVTSSSLRDLTLRDAKSFGIPSSQVLLEPKAKNTAAAIGYLCLSLKRQNLGASVVGIFPADHLIEKEQAFREALAVAKKEAEQGRITTLGIRPNQPSTGYGYIQIGKLNGASSDEFSSFQVQEFHEKPNLETAIGFIHAGNFFWNAGIFVFKVDKMIEAFAKHMPAMWSKLNEINQDLSNLETIYAELESISIDYAIMENLDSSELACVPCDIGWSDVGSWDAIQELLTAAAESASTQSSIQGSLANSPESEALTSLPDNKIEIKGRNNFVHAHKDKKYVFVGMSDALIVDTEDALLVASKGASQDVKEAVDRVKVKWPALAQDHTHELRPWGRYDILRDETHFKSKVIEVHAGQQISYQSHAHREEHWLIIKGLGEVILNDKVIPVKRGTYINIPLGAKHRIRNTGSESIEFVEVQLGSYFGEDDIVRYQDDYLRV